MDRILYLADREKELRETIMSLLEVKGQLQRMVRRGNDRESVYRLLCSIAHISDIVTAILKSEYDAVLSELLTLIQEKTK